MNKLTITTLTLAFAFTGAIAAQQPAAQTTAQPAAPAQQAQTAKQLSQAETAAGKKKVKKGKSKAKKVVKQQEEAVTYTEMRIGDPRIVYHQIGTAGAQKGNTIVPFYNEPIRSSKPYEIRYDYADFGRN